MVAQQEQIKQYIRDRYPQLSEPGLVEEISHFGQLMSFKSGETLMDFGSYIRFVPLVIEGSIKVMREDEMGNELFLYYLNDGDTCSMSFSCCMMHKKSDIRTIAEEDTVLIGIPIKQVDNWMSRYKSWQQFVMQSYDLRMRELINTIDEIAFKRMDERLQNYLEKKANASGSQVLQTTHQQIAQDMNASREAISRLLKRMEDEGMVRLGRNRVELV